MNLILVIAAIVISVLVFTWLVKVVKATLTTAILIAAIVFALHFIFGIGPDKIGQQLVGFLQFIWEVVTGQRR